MSSGKRTTRREAAPPADRIGAEGEVIGGSVLSRISFVAFVLVLFPTFAFSLDKAISGVAPEFQEAAQQRRAELARQTFCNEKAAMEKVTKRDLAPFVVSCMDKVEKAEQAIRK